MEIQEILDELAFNRGKFPRKALQAAVAAKDEITPELIRIVEEATRNIEVVVEEESYLAHFFAMYLLAQFREQRAYRPIVEFFSIPGETVMDVIGDTVTEDLARILASVSGGDTTLIERLAENPETNEYVRHAALDAWVVMVCAGMKTRDEALAYIATLFRGKVKREPDFLWDGLVSSTTDLYPAELMDDIRQAFADDLIDPMYIDLPWVEEQLQLGQEQVMAKTCTRPQNKLVENVVEELSGWAMWQEASPPTPEERRKLGGEPVSARATLPASQPAARAVPAPQAKRVKIGRNDPCPCGSGKKYKKCCGRSV